MKMHRCTSNELYFTSSRGTVEFMAEGKPFTSIYKAATRGANVDVTTVQSPPAGINDDLRNGCPAFTPMAAPWHLPWANTQEKGEQMLTLPSRFRNGEWSEPQRLNINTQFKDEYDAVARNNSWDSSPAFSPDAAHFILPPTDRADGGTDIYSAQMDSRTIFTRAKPLSEINTSGNELFPYVSEDVRSTLRPMVILALVGWI